MIPTIIDTLNSIVIIYVIITSAESYGWANYNKRLIIKSKSEDSW